MMLLMVTTMWPLPSASLRRKPAVRGFGESRDPAPRGIVTLFLMLQALRLAHADGGTWAELESLVVMDSFGRNGGPSLALVFRWGPSSPSLDTVAGQLLSFRAATVVANVATRVAQLLHIHLFIGGSQLKVPAGDGAGSLSTAPGEEREVCVGTCIIAILYIMYSARKGPRHLSLPTLPRVPLLRGNQGHLHDANSGSPYLIDLWFLGSHSRGGISFPYTALQLHPAEFTQCINLLSSLFSTPNMGLQDITRTGRCGELAVGNHCHWHYSTCGPHSTYPLGLR